MQNLKNLITAFLQKLPKPYVKNALSRLPFIARFAGGTKSTASVIAHPNEPEDTVHGTPNLIGDRLLAVQNSQVSRVALRFIRSQLKHWGILKDRQIIGRHDCYYNCFPMHDAPAQERRGILELKIRQWQPVVDADFNRVWQGGAVQVWCWPKQLTEPGKTPVVETRCYQQPDAADALRLLHCQQGVEGQIWRQQVLIASRWWRQTPTTTEWSNFQRSVGLIPGALPTTLQTLPLLVRPWGKNQQPQHEIVTPTTEARLWRAVLLIAVALLSWEGARVYRIQQEIASVKSQQHAVTQKIAPLLDARQQGLLAQQTIAQLTALAQSHKQLRLINDLSGKIDITGPTRLVSWEYRPGTISIVLANPRLDHTGVMQALSQLPWAKDIGFDAETRTGSITLNIKLD